MSIKLKNGDLFQIKNVITRIKDKGNNKFKLALILNEIKIDERIEALKKLNEPSKELQKFNNERDPLAREHAELDQQGNMKVYSLPDGKGELKKDGIGYPNIIKEKKVFEDKLDKLKVKYKKAIDEGAKKQEEFLETLKEDVKPIVKLELIDFENIPEISFEDMKVLMPMISR